MGAAEELAEPLEDFPNKDYKEAREVRRGADNLRPEDQEDDNHRLEDQGVEGTAAPQAVVKNTAEGPEDLEAYTWAPKPDHTLNLTMSLSLEIQGKTSVEKQIAKPVSPHMWQEIGPASPSCFCLSTNLRLSLSQFLLYLLH